MVPQDLSMLKLQEDVELQATYGFSHVETHGSRGELADYIFDIIRSRVASGFKFVFPELLPPPACSAIAHVIVKIQPGAKRKAAVPPSGQQPELKKTKGSHGGVVPPQPAPTHPLEQFSGAREGQALEGQARGDQPQPAPRQTFITLVSIVESLQSHESPITGAMPAEAKSRPQEELEEEVLEEQEVKTLPHPTKLKMKELKGELQARGLPVSGRRDDLVTRLCIALSRVPVPGTLTSSVFFKPSRMPTKQDKKLKLLSMTLSIYWLLEA